MNRGNINIEFHRTQKNGFVFVDSIGIELMNVKEGSLLGERGLDS